MKKISTVVVVCIISTQLIGQTKTKRQLPPPVPPVEMTAPPAQPLPPPPPPAPPAEINDVAIANVPAPPTPPPAPPAPPAITLPFKTVNEKGYSMTIKTVNDKTIIKVKKGGFSEIIPMEKWNANQVYYEKRYGKLPPPPPPAPVVEEVKFTQPVIVKDN